MKVVDGGRLECPYCGSIWILDLISQKDTGDYVEEVYKCGACGGKFIYKDKKPKTHAEEMAAMIGIENW